MAFLEGYLSETLHNNIDTTCCSLLFKVDNSVTLTSSVSASGVHQRTLLATFAWLKEMSR